MVSFQIRHYSEKAALGSTVAAARAEAASHSFTALYANEQRAAQVDITRRVPL